MTSPAESASWDRYDLRLRVEDFVRGDCTAESLAQELSGLCTAVPGAAWDALSVIDQQYRRGKLGDGDYQLFRHGIERQVFGVQGPLPRPGAPRPAAQAPRPALVATSQDPELQALRTELHRVRSDARRHRSRLLRVLAFARGERQRLTESRQSREAAEQARGAAERAREVADRARGAADRARETAEQAREAAELALATTARELAAVRELAARKVERLSTREWRRSDLDHATHPVALPVPEAPAAAPVAPTATATATASPVAVPADVVADAAVAPRVRGSRVLRRLDLALGATVCLAIALAASIVPGLRPVRQAPVVRHVAAPPVAPVPRAPQPGVIGLSAERYIVFPGAASAQILVERSGDLARDAGFVWWTEGSGARPGKDFVAQPARPAQFAAGAGSMTLTVPVLANAGRRHTEMFYVVIARPSGGATLGEIRRAPVILMPPDHGG